MDRLSEKFEIDEGRFTASVQTRLRESITNGGALKLSAHVITPEAEENLKEVFEAILIKFDASDLAMTGQLILKELTTNAVKANLKHYLAKEKSALLAEKPGEFMIEFRKVLSSGGALPYKAALQAAGLSIAVVFEFTAESLTIKVSNSFSVAGDEKKRIQEKLAQATSVGDMRKFFDQNKQDAEGAGLGFAMLINTLKSAGVDPSAFTFDMDQESTTVAQVVLPLAVKKN